ncbi:MAG: hypothetical protein Q9174_003420 [Haloplaca sp. 1 TL-2023]
MSYCCGSPESTNRIWLGDNVYIEINASAAQLLRHTAAESSIWIDSVCISQRDDAKKSLQVMIMYGIYKFAEHVYAWLGGAEHNAVQAMHLIFDAVEPWITKDMTGRDPVGLPMSRDYPGMVFHYDADAWGALKQLLERPLFCGIWIIREMVTAKDPTLVYALESGNEFVSWEHLIKVIEHMQSFNCLQLLEMKDVEKPWAAPIFPRRIEGIIRFQVLMRSTSGNDEDRRSMQDNLILAATAEASDPRDKIFALRSMSRGTLVEALVPNYHLSACEVFTNATRYIVTYDKCFPVLHMAGIGWTKSLLDLPSWVPDDSCPRPQQSSKPRPLLLGEYAATRPDSHCAASYYTCETPAKIVTWAWAPPLIGLTGIIIDKIDNLCHGLSPPQSVWHSLTCRPYAERKKILSWYNEAREVLLPCSNTRVPYLDRTDHGPLAPALSLEDAFRRTLIVGVDCENVLYHDRDVGPEHFKAFLYLLLHTVSHREDNSKVELFDRESLEKAKKYIKRLDQVSDWTVFRTSHGYLGRGPPLLQQGDQICVFMGGRVPFVIRKTHLRFFRLFCGYRLVGE